MSELQILEREHRFTLRDIERECDKETPNHTYLFNARLYRCTLEREIEAAKKRETPEYKFLAAMQENAELAGSFCGFY